MRRPRAVALCVAASLVLGTGGLVLAPTAGSASVAAVAPGNGKWSAPATLFGDSKGASLGAVSCASADSCVAVGTKGGTFGSGVVASGATTWSSPDVIDRYGGLTDASCSPGGPCLAVGKGVSADGNSYRYRVGKWSSGPISPVLISSVSCASADFCAGVGFLNYASAFTYNGTAWSAQIPISANGTTISCPTATFCAVGSDRGDILYYQAGKWSKATPVDPGRELSSVSCLSAAFCAAVDSSGNALIDENGRWSKPDYAKPLDRESSLTGVSCATSKFCVAVDTGGNAYFWDGSRWSAPEAISVQVAFSSVSCPTTRFCAAGGQGPFTSPTKAYVATWAPSVGAVPPAPANLHASASDEEVALSWSKPANDGGSAITGYTVLWRTGTSSAPAQVALGATVTNYTVTGLTNGTAYQFAVEAVNASGTGPATAWASASPTANSPPLPPTGLRVTIRQSPYVAVGGVSGEIDLYWSRPASGGCAEQAHAACTLSGYTLSYDAEVNSGQGLSPLTTTFAATATSGSVRSLLDLHSDTFTLVADNHYGQSAPAQVTVPLELVPPAPTVTAVPAAGQVTLSWTDYTTRDQKDAIGTVSYSLIYGTSKTSETPPPSSQLSLGSTTLAHSGQTELDYTATVNGLADDTKYYFTVFGTSGAGRGPPSSSVSAITFGLPGAPSGLSAKAANRQVFLTWQAPTYDGGTPLTAYDVYMGTSAGGEAAVPVTSTTATSALVHQDPATVRNGTKYYFTVKAVNAVGAGPGSNEVSATPEAVPGAPADLKAMAGGGSVKLTWAAPNLQGGSAITGYDLYQGTAPGGEGPTPEKLPASPTSYTVTGLSPGSPYYFYVAAVNASGLGQASAEVSATPTTVLHLPGQPQDVVAQRADREVFLTWLPPADDGGSRVTAYDVYMGTSPGGEAAAPVTSTTATSALVHQDPATVRNGTKYYFTVKAVNAVGAGPGSNEVSATPEPVPGAPADLEATAGGGSVKLTWAAPSSQGGSAVTGYDLYRGTAPGGEGATPEQLPASPTSYTVTGLTSASPYYFYVAAANASGVGQASNEASAIPTGAPGAPIEFKATAGDLGVALSWSKPANDGGSAITGYTVLWRTGTSSAPAQVALGATVTNYTVTGLTNGTAYQFAVEAVNASGTGPATAWASASPTANSPPLPPTGLRVTIRQSPYVAVGGVSGEIDLYWSRPASGGCAEQAHAACTLSGYTLSYDAEVNSGQGLSPLTTTFAATATSGSVRSLLDLHSDTFTLVADNHYGQSAPAQVTVPLELVPPAPTVTAVPAAGQVTLSWTDYTTRDQKDAIGTVSYSLIYGTSKTSETPPPSSQLSLGSTTLAHSGQTELDYTATVNGLADDTKYYFTVFGTSGAGRGPPSSSVSAITFGLPGAPSGLSAKAANRQVFLTWQAPTYDGGTPLTAYDVYMGTSAGGEAAVPVTSTTATSALVHQDPATVRNGTKYYFTVKAVNAVGAGPGSNEVSATPEPGG